MGGYLALLRPWKAWNASYAVIFLGVALSSLAVVVLLAATYRTMRRPASFAACSMPATSLFGNRS